jgi:hypothetical protein
VNDKEYDRLATQEQDAKRYRYLRNARSNYAFTIWETAMGCGPEELDKLIDEAIEQDSEYKDEQ